MSKKLVFIVPSTHWDREWYLPFQSFRTDLVHLIDQLLEILSKHDYYFMLDGQTIVLEDYFEIRPERKEELLSYIRKGKIDVGPWYLLPDEWLVGQESLVRNLEMSIELANELEIPLMNIGYLPDQFGHTRAIPQLLTDLTTFEAVFIWRGVGSEISTVPFIWKSHAKSTSSILCNYMPFGYGNAASLPDELKILEDVIKQKIEQLQPFSPINTYLLMNGTDHQLPQKHLIDLISKLKIENTEIRIALLNDYLEQLNKLMSENNYLAPIYSGEFRSSLRAPLLQDTYSARIWIKQWDNKIEDLLVHYAEPINTILYFFKGINYPSSYITLAWKWLLKNQPHDSICGCSVDQTHEEMKSRFYWAEDIANNQINRALEQIAKDKSESKELSILSFNPTNNSKLPSLIEFNISSKYNINSIQDIDGKEYEVQPLKTTEKILFENTMKPFMIRAGLKMLPGRKLMDFYLNEAYISESLDPKTCNITLICGKEPIGELNTDEMTKQVFELLDSKKYTQFYIKATLGTKQSYVSLLPLKAWSFNKFIINQKSNKKFENRIFNYNKNSIENQFYFVKFNKNGTFDLFDKMTNTHFNQLHNFEDFGDRGDEYTFGRLKPIVSKISSVKRRILNKGPIFCEIQQDMSFKTYKEVNEKRNKRIGKTIIPIKTIFRFYRDLPRIEISTTLTNTAKDHRLRICFNLPYKSDYTITSTHFGAIKRQGSSVPYDKHVEQPSGIQAQKRFIRVDDDKSEISFTLFNKGLPEVELVDKSRLALTLIRSTGYLSRMDYPERPIHAGPFIATPGAQELNKEFTFNYGIICHKKDEPITFTADQSEAFALPTKSITFENSEPNSNLTEKLIHVENPFIRISSLRIRNNNLFILMFNLDESELETDVIILDKFTKCKQIMINGEVKSKIIVENGKFNIKFKPFEIKLLRFS